MSKRLVDTSFWNDNDVVERFTVDDRYFWLYLMTNPKISISGVMPFSITIIGRDLGYDKNVVTSIIRRFSTELNKIIVDEETKELYFVDWYKYNWTSSPKLAISIINDIENIKSETIKNAIAQTISKFFSDTVSIPYLYRIAAKKDEEKEIESFSPTPPFQRLQKEEEINNNISRLRAESLDENIDIGRGDSDVIAKDVKNKQILSDEAREIYDLWSSIAPIKPRCVSEAIVRAIKGALGRFSIKDITDAISHYVEAYNDPKFFFKYKWDLVTFLKRKNCVPNFMDGGTIWENYVQLRKPKKEVIDAPTPIVVSYYEDGDYEQ